MACARGRVQGVGYRFFVDDCAGETGVTGFVRNMPDGSVVIVAEGSDDALDRFLRMIQAPGRGRIRVDSLEVTRGEATGEFSGFQIRA
ncbi:MAG TPA: acylphosphatase [Methanoregula sp.]|nr:acylphosphatase [Methanoregula sp.]